MPGIVGLITKMTREDAEQQLIRMVEALCHEEFYVAGTFGDESLGIYVGWVARRGSFSDGMPLRNERGEVTLIFQGEEFAEPGIAQRLQGRGHQMNVAGPSYLVHSYEEDPSFPAGLNGRFHGLVIDRARGSAMFFNDRYGMERIYWHECDDAFYFAAEAKAILAVRPELRAIDPRALGEFVTCGCTLENRSLFKDIQLLPGGSRWLFQRKSLVKKETYFEPREWEEQEKLDSEQYYRELREVFSRNLPRYFAGKESIAMSLTGGLDTRMIMAWRRPEPASLPCYTFGGILRDCHDVTVARRVAKACGQVHQVIPITGKFLSKFAHYAEKAVYLSDGCADVSRAPDAYWNENAREIAPVRMTGNYGGELLRGIRTFRPVQPMAGLFQPEFYSYAHQAAETYARVHSGNDLSFAIFRQAPWNHYATLSIEQSQLALRTPFFDNELVRTVYRAPELSLSASDGSVRLIADGNRNLLGIPTDRGLLGNSGRLPSAVSRTALEFSFKAEYAYDMGMPQSLARVDHFLRGFHLERFFLGRHKVSHFRTWYRDSLAGYVREILLDSRSLSRSYIDRKGVEAIVAGHLRGDRNYTNEIHKLLTLEIAHRVLLDAPIPRVRKGADHSTTVAVKPVGAAGGDPAPWPVVSG